MVRILAELSAGAGGQTTARLCEVSRDALGMSGAGIMLMSGALSRGSLCTTDEVSGLIEDLQYTLGEGPCLDAYHQDRVVAEPNLAHSSNPRWLAFTPPAVAAGVAAVFAFPIRQGAVHLGAMNLYRNTAGPLSDDEHTDGLVIADLAARWVLDIQADAPPETLAAELELGADFHFAVHNAAGKVSVQAGIDITDALIRLRAHAFGTNQLLRDVAQDVVAGTLRFD
jgi:hypothetical protein